MPSDGPAQKGGTPPPPGLFQLLQKQRESEEENLKEECSSTESTHQEVRRCPVPRAPSHVGLSETPSEPDFLPVSPQHEDSSSSWRPGQLDLGHLEDERVCVLARIDELKARLVELEQQLQESKQEVGGAPGAQPGPGLALSRPLFLLQAEMERALLQGERQAELEQLESETDAIAQLQRKLDELEEAVQREKDKVGWETHTHTHTHTRTHTHRGRTLLPSPPAPHRWWLL